MCLAVPGKLVRWLDRDPLLARGEVEFAGVSRVCHLACVPAAVAGDYLLVHAGIAIARIDEQEAQRVFAELQRLDDDGDWGAAPTADRDVGG
ncbi:MAG: HypC/HybG/HupF family hydrogenase formation chaperone [Pirellulales bacterium]